MRLFHSSQVLTSIFYRQAETASVFPNAAATLGHALSSSLNLALNMFFEHSIQCHRLAMLKTDEVVNRRLRQRQANA